MHFISMFLIYGGGIQGSFPHLTLTLCVLSEITESTSKPAIKAGL